jgi:hypothetical protein
MNRGPWGRTISIALLAAAAIALLLAPAALGQGAKPWPPLDGPGDLFVHFGEEHVNDVDGPTILPRIVRESARYRPRLVAMSGDKANDGTPEQLGLWADVMEHYDRRGVPWFAGVGNHDRKAPSGMPGGVSPVADFSPYAEFFADRPYPMGDGRGYRDPRISPRQRPASDPPGAASHYFVEYRGTRWIFLDNSCWSIIACDSQQNPSGQNEGGSESQLDFLRRVGREAKADGKLAFAVMHMPTRDPGDQTYREPIAVQHTMGKTVLGVQDNALFEQAALDAGLDAVFVAHIKGQFSYRGSGDIPYFINGGGGGELYTTGPVGVDHGYWHGFMLVRAQDQRFRTDSVPVFVSGGIRVEGRRALDRGEAHTFEAFGRQPVFEHHAKVDALELRDPAPIPRSGAAGVGWLGGVAKWAGPPFALVVILLLTAPGARRRRLAAPALAALGALAVAGVSAAQQSEPTSTPVESLPNPARIWTTQNPLVLRPVASESDDPRRDARTQTKDGRFRGACPGRARLTIASGFESANHRVVVRSDRGRIVRRMRRGAGTLRAGQPRVVARVGLAQPARLVARVFRRGGGRVATLRRACIGRAGAVKLRWDGRRAGKRARAVAPGRYLVRIRALSDRKPVTRSFKLRVR